MFFLFKWFRSLLSSLGLYNKRANILFLGLDNAGKTTLLHVLRDDKIAVHEPTRHPQMEELKIGNVCFVTHDLGGHAAARRLWKSYFTQADGIVFVVDATDHSRFREAETELQKLMTDDYLTSDSGDLTKTFVKKRIVPIAVLGNKIDSPNAVKHMTLMCFLNLLEGDLKTRVFMCSVVQRTGYQDAFKWLAEQL